MDLFGDKRYDELDWLSKAVEPITWSMCEVLASLPNEVVIANDVIIEWIRGDIGHNGIRFNSAWEHYMKPTYKKRIRWQELEAVQKCFEFQIADGFTVDLENNKVYGELKLVKIKENFDEKELSEKLKSVGRDIRFDTGSYDGQGQIRAREILDLIGTPIANETKSKRSVRGFGRSFGMVISDVMEHNRWNIRDIDLATRLMEWINLYVREGNLAAMRNFCMLKVVTHRGYPIYNIEEEET